MDVVRFLSALHFAAEKHKDQRRKGADASPYIKHPIEVAEILARHGNPRNIELLQAPILHDRIEDTNTTGEEIERKFGAAVRQLVEEVTDDKNPEKAVRKQRSITHRTSPGGPPAEDRRQDLQRTRT